MGTVQGLHRRHHSAFRVEKKGSGKHKPWTVHHPTDPTSDYQPQDWFATYPEAINHAQRLAFRQALIWQFEAYLDDNQNVTVSSHYDHTGLDTMYRIWKWWGNYSLAHFLENV